MDQLRYTVLDAGDDELKSAVVADLRQYNRSRNAAWFEALAAPSHAARPLHVFALDSANRPLGGLVGETQLAWLKIQNVSILAEARRRGIGSRLMSLAESEATNRGCKYAFLDTMSYQAPDFYQKLGYRIAGQLDDWDSHGHAKFFLVKTLAGAPRCD